jgi:hypothetical protein
LDRSRSRSCGGRGWRIVDRSRGACPRVGSRVYRVGGSEWCSGRLVLRTGCRLGPASGFWAGFTRCPGSTGCDIKLDVGPEHFEDALPEQARVLLLARESRHGAGIREGDRQGPAVEAGQRRIGLDRHPEELLLRLQDVHDFRPGTAEHLDRAGRTGARGTGLLAGVLGRLLARGGTGRLGWVLRRRRLLVRSGLRRSALRRCRPLLCRSSGTVAVIRTRLLLAGGGAGRTGRLARVLRRHRPPMVLWCLARRAGLGGRRLLAGGGAGRPRVVRPISRLLGGSGGGPCGLGFGLRDDAPGSAPVAGRIGGGFGRGGLLRGSLLALRFRGGPVLLRGCSIPSLLDRGGRGCRLLGTGCCGSLPGGRFHDGGGRGCRPLRRSSWCG